LARKILLADDSVTAQSMGRRILTDAGYEVTTVSNGSAALKRIAESKPDLIVLDVYMPGYGGLEICQRLKETRETSRIPVLLSVGKLEPFKPEEARRVRADAYIVKPFEASELLTALTKLEDKIVAQPEPYKQGRFAKAVAALDPEAAARGHEEGFGDSDTGWKERLVIPSPGSKSAEPESEAAHAAETGFRNLARDEDFKPAEPSREFERPIPAGLPADISAEEIAAIAAAAAAISGGETATAPGGEIAEPVASAAAPELAPEPATVNEQPVAEASAPAQEPKIETPADEPPSEAPAATFASAPELAVEAPHIADEASPEFVSAPAAAEPPQFVEAVAGNEAAPTSEAPPPVEIAAPPVEPEAPSMPEAAVAEVPLPAPPDADLVAALASLAPSNGDATSHPRDANAVPGMLSSAELAAVNAGISGPRWIAEAIALDEQESAFILEQEMQKAYAAMAAAEAAQTMAMAAEVAPAEMPPASSPSLSAFTAPEFYATPVAAPEEASPPSVNSFETAPTLPSEPTVAAEVGSESPSVAEPAAVASASDTPTAVTEEAAFAAAAGAAAEAVPAMALTSAPVEPAPGPAAEFDESARQRESELAAAWASWKPAHEASVESQTPVPAPEPEAVPSAPKEEPRTAKEEPPAAEATSEPEAAPADEAGEISEIVDDMLAELKPKLMAEISKKLKKSKGKK